MSFLLRNYQRSIKNFPYMAQGLQSAVLSSTGDAIAQIVVEKKSSFDYKRSANFLLIGFFGGMGLRKWYGVLQNRFSSSPSRAINTLKKVSVDQLLFAPIFLGATLGSIALLQGNKPKEVKKKLMREYPDILFASYKLWPAVQLINFSFVPLNYQVVVAQIISVAWNTFVSVKTNLHAVVEHDKES